MTKDEKIDAILAAMAALEGESKAQRARYEQRAKTRAAAVKAHLLAQRAATNPQTEGWSATAPDAREVRIRAARLAAL